MSDIFEKQFWNEIEAEKTKIVEDHFLSELSENADCHCPICDMNFSEKEKNWASEQLDKWISKWG